MSNDLEVFIAPDGAMHEIPDHLREVKMNKDGLPDKRSARYSEFMAWVESLDAEDAPAVEPEAPAKEPMNQLALRIWNGQSLSAPEDWRVMRVIEGLKSHGYDIAGLELPVENIGKYL